MSPEFCILSRRVLNSDKVYFCDRRGCVFLGQRDYGSFTGEAFEEQGTEGNDSKI
jgi:hypothetical protein